MKTIDMVLMFICFFILLTVYRLSSFLPPMVRIILSLVAMGIGIYEIVQAILEYKNRHKS